MITSRFLLAPILLASCILYVQPSFAVKIVRLQLEYGSDAVVAKDGLDIPKTNKSLDLELFDEQTPATVANYLNYVHSGRYDLTFFSRSITGFILQTGGVANISSDPENDTLGSSFVTVEEFDPVINEPGISNTRGTISMARIGGQVDSANSEWFINLRDNSTSLDKVDEGFTVFGSVIDDGMLDIEQIASFPTISIGFFNNIAGTSLDDLPLADIKLPTNSQILQRNLVMILSVNEINRPVLRFTPAITNFGFESTSSVVSGKIVDVVLKNTGNEVLDIGMISTEAPFSIQADNCSNTSLEPVSVSPTSSCTLSLKFLPASIAIFNGDLNIAYSSQITADAFSVKHPLVGEGSLGAPVISVAGLFDVGTAQIDGFPTTRDITVSNTGQASLIIATISGFDSTGFSQTNNCIGAEVLIAPGETCDITVTFTTSNFEQKTATLVIESNDPDNSVINIDITGNGDNDADGITTAIEDAAPNAGDNNFDGEADSTQNSVASFVSNDGSYITVLARPFSGGNAVVSVVSVASNRHDATGLQSDIQLKHGDIGLQIDVEQLGDRAEVGLILPVTNSNLTAYYFFGETEANTTPHWHPYEAARVIKNAALTATNEKQSRRDLIQLVVEDGGPGDSDKKVNGRIVLAHGAPAYSSKESDSGSLSIIFLLFFTTIMVVLKRRY
jgi:peptidyl-prolyl cis-trans isomerase A (cyclophilin A)